MSEQWDDDILELVYKVQVARKAIEEHLRANRMRLRRISGQCPCPHCGGTLHFSIAGNGHHDVTCSTKDCVNWVE